jgi:hypothetical protein
MNISADQNGNISNNNVDQVFDTIMETNKPLSTVTQDNSEPVTPEQPLVQDQNNQQSTPNKLTVEIDPEFANLPDKYTAAYRTMQARYDRAQAEAARIKKELEVANVAKSLFDTIVQDEEALIAFLNQRKPELVKNYSQKSFKEFAQSELSKDFGDGFVFDPDQANDPLSDHYAYRKKAENLRTVYEQRNAPVGQTLEQYLKNKEIEYQKTNEMFQQEIVKLKNEMKWDDKQVNDFFEFSKKATPLDLAKLFTVSKMKVTTPNVGNIQSQPSVQPAKQVDKIFDNIMNSNTRIKL